ncbi:MAG TPA: hypothetical protein VNT51_03600 [Miltoncostaeaceae bacterium]|nr:hypothetical protein [Miltoncostaeaceae bacterium]
MSRPARSTGRGHRPLFTGALALLVLLIAQVASAMGATQVWTGTNPATPDIGLSGIEFFYPDGSPITIDGDTATTINFTIDGEPQVGYCIDTTRLFSVDPEEVVLAAAEPTAANRAITWILLNRTPTGAPTPEKELQGAAGQLAVWLLRNQVSQTTPSDDPTLNAAAFALRDEALAATATPAALQVSATSPTAGARQSTVTVTGAPGAVVDLSVTSGSGTFSAGRVTLDGTGRGQVVLSTSDAGAVTVTATTAGDGELVEVIPADGSQATVFARPATLSAATTVTFTTAQTTTPGTVTTPGPTPGGVATQTPRARLVITKVGPRTARGGQNVRYVIRVTNRGRGVARNVRVSDRIPSGLAVTRRNYTTLRNGQAVWSIGTLRPGQSRTITISLRAALRLSGSRTNVAIASATGLQPVSARAVTTFTPAPRRVQPRVTG